MKSLLLVGLSLLPLGAIWAQSNEPKPAVSAETPTEAKTKAKADNFAPLDYFQDNCQRCHGPNGSFYGPTFGKNLKNDAALREIVKAMCEGPGQAPLPDPQLEVLTDFHRALRDNKPYLTVVSQQKTDKGLVLSGDATPDAKITLEGGAVALPVALEGHKWSVALPAGFDASKAKLRATKDGEESVVDVEK